MTICAKCGNSLEPKVRFCSGCGAEVGVRLRSEYRIVTVLFCEVVRSTNLGRQLDPLATQQLLERYGETVRTTLGEGGVSVGTPRSDGYMAAFGVRELHEGDALRAVRAAPSSFAESCRS